MGHLTQTYSTLVDNLGEQMAAFHAEGQWNNRWADLSAFAGKTVSQYQLITDSSSPAGTYAIYYGDIAIVSSNGSVISIYDGQQGASFPNVYNTGQTSISAVEQSSDLTGDAEQPMEVTAFYHGDQIGSARLVTAAGGWPISTDTFFPFGEELAPPSDPNHYKFTGKERDPESGNDYFGARFYSSSWGRFMSPDPLPWIHWQRGSEDDQKKFEAYIANPQNLNMYTYVLNNPLSKTDPTGMNACGTNNDSSCKVTVTIQDRSKDANGNYNDKYTGVKNQGNYNATAVVNVNGKDVGTFLVKTTPSDSNSGAPLASGVYSGTLTEHNGHEAIRIQPTNDLPTNGPNPTHGGAWFAQGDLIHQAGINNFTGVGRDGRAVSDGCLVVCTSQFGDFSTATGMNASPPQRHFTVDVDTSANQLNVSQ